MHQRKRSNVMILELIIVILFFSLATSITMQVFVKAHQRSGESVRTTYALIAAEDWAEQVYASENPEKMLLDKGWKLVGEKYTYQMREDRLSIEITTTREPRDAGEMFRMTVEVFDEVPQERATLVTLPVDRYLSKEGVAP